MVKQEVRVITEREVWVFRDLMRFRIFLDLVFMVGVTSCVSIYNIFNFIIAGGGEGCKFEVGNYKNNSGGPHSRRALQEAWIEDLLRKYYWSH